MDERVSISVAAMLEDGIDALARADAARLQQLAEAAQKSPWPATEPEFRRARERQRVFAHLLRLTRHNLRVLGSSYGARGPYGHRQG